MLKRCLFLVALPLLTLSFVPSAPAMDGFVDKIAIETKTVGRVTFSHMVHGASCDICHPQIFQKKNNSNHTTMQAMEKGKSCGTCHNGKKAFSVTGNCVTCHAGDILYKVKEPGNVTFPHAAHIEAFGCEECHPVLFKAQRGANRATMAEMEKGKSCGACHDGSKAFNVADACDSCHKM